MKSLIMGIVALMIAPVWSEARGLDKLCQSSSLDETKYPVVAVGFYKELVPLATGTNPGRTTQWCFRTIETDGKTITSRGDECAIKYYVADRVSYITLKFDDEAEGTIRAEGFTEMNIRNSMQLEFVSEAGSVFEQGPIVSLCRRANDEILVEYYDSLSHGVHYVRFVEEPPTN